MCGVLLYNFRLWLCTLGLQLTGWGPKFVMQLCAEEFIMWINCMNTSVSVFLWIMLADCLLHINLAIILFHWILLLLCSYSKSYLNMLLRKILSNRSRDFLGSFPRFPSERRWQVGDHIKNTWGSCKWFPPYDHTPHLSQHRAKEHRWREINKGNRNRGIRKLKWHLGAGSAGKNAAESNRLQFIPAQPHSGRWSWRKRSRPLRTFRSFSSAMD